jgi:thiamine pyrophosphate-dependent acetolactate synthase large subunit-like protein
MIHGADRPAIFLGGARLHFDEDEFLLRFVAANDVHFASSWPAEVAIEDLIAVALEMAGGKIFTQAAEC